MASGPVVATFSGTCWGTRIKIEGMEAGQIFVTCSGTEKHGKLGEKRI